MKNQVGQTFGCYTVIENGEDRVLPSGQRKKTYKVICKCGNKRVLDKYKITHNNYQHCDECKPNTKNLKIDLIGRKFGRLEVIKRDRNLIQPNGSTKVKYICRCDCGNIVSIQSHHLVSNHTKSCGCLHKEKMSELLSLDLTNRRFGKLTAISLNKNIKGRNRWNCVCECGGKKITDTSSLLNGKTKSCGCLSSVAESELIKFLMKEKIEYKSQVKFEDCKDIRCLPFDLGIYREGKLILLIELQGQQHYNPFTFNGESNDIKVENYRDRIKKDKIKESFCMENNIKLLLIKYTDFNRKNEIVFNVLKNLEEIDDVIINEGSEFY